MVKALASTHVAFNSDLLRSFAMQRAEARAAVFLVVASAAVGVAASGLPVTWADLEGIDKGGAVFGAVLAFAVTMATLNRADSVGRSTAARLETELKEEVE